MTTRTVLTLGSWAPLWLSGMCFASPFATRVIDYAPGPGQHVNNPAFNDPARALGPPAGGGLVAADNSKVVTLGAYGGTLTLGFDHRIPARPAAPDNPRGVCAIVYGNAFHVGGDPNRRWAEAAVIEVSRDDNGNGVADDAWYVIRGSHTPAPAESVRAEKTYIDPAVSGAPPQFPASWLPPGRAGTAWTVGTYQLPAAVFASASVPIVANPAGGEATEQGVWGYADCSPTLLLGDTNADDEVDDWGIAAEDFYTLPGDPLATGVNPGSGGGDGFSLEWAVDASTGLPPSPPLDGFDFVRITTAAERLSGPLGELSTEIGGVAEAIPLSARVPPVCPLDFNGDTVVNPDDLGDFITAYFEEPSDPRSEFNGDGTINPDDLGDFITAYFEEPRAC